MYIISNNIKRDIITAYQRKRARLRLKNHPGSPESDQGCHSDAGSVAFPSVASGRFIWFKVGRRQRSQGLCGKWTPPPTPFFQ